MTNPKILISEAMAGPSLDDLEAEFSVIREPDLWKDPEGLAAALHGCHALIVRNQTNVTSNLLAEAPSLKVIGRAGAGLDNIDVRAATEAGIVVASTPDQNSVSVAELVLAMMLALARKILPADANVRKGGWDRQRFTGIELYGKTLGIVGLGRIGFLTASRARSFGMNILAHDEFLSPDAATVVETHAELTGLDELLERSDFISCHLPLNAETRGFFDYARFSRMRPGAFFLNLSRGEVVDEAGLVRALQEGRISGAGLDVREKEPPEISPLTEMDNVILTPHIAAFTVEGQERVIRAVCADVAAVLRGRAARNFVNFARPGNSLSVRPVFS